MKKNIFFVSLFILFLSSCSSGYFTGIYTYNFYNNSSVTVNLVTNNNIDNYVLKPSESISLKLDHGEGYTLKGNQRVTIIEERKRAHDLYYVYINDMDFVYMKFFNFSNYDIIITEQNGLLGENFNDFLYIKAGDTVITKVFTITPNFDAIFADSKMSAINAFSSTILTNP